MLSAEGVSLRFGGIAALKDVSFNVWPHEIFSIIGPNGAGKTSILNCLSGYYKPQQGRITFESRELNGLKAHQRAALGLGRTFQNLELFRNMTVLENILLGRHLFMQSGILSGGFFLGKALREEESHRLKAEEIIDFLEIHSARRKLVSELPYGIQKRVELGRALAAEPKLLLLDEPAAGMNLEETEDIVRFILDVHEEFHATVI
ncbi:MAG: ABC transporter ATP-binding protein, partial [Deltaproteobacteria bacterium]|nr:ABC transporter ATP-binding protein [Deltaproteobacteria bacterium]